MAATSAGGPALPLATRGTWPQAQQELAEQACGQHPVKTSLGPGTPSSSWASVSPINRELSVGMEIRPDLKSKSDLGSHPGSPSPVFLLVSEPHLQAECYSSSKDPPRSYHKSDHDSCTNRPLQAGQGYVPPSQNKCLLRFPQPVSLAP